jgi:hypothetical protein
MRQENPNTLDRIWLALKGQKALPSNKNQAPIIHRHVMQVKLQLGEYTVIRTIRKEESK